MIVICEGCGKKYRVDPSIIKGKAASFKCHACSHVILVAKPRKTSSPTTPKQMRKAISAPAIDDRLASEGAEEVDATHVVDKGTLMVRQRHRARGFGLRAKMLILFLFIPAIIIAGISLFYLWQLETNSYLLVQQNTKIVTKLAEDEFIGLQRMMNSQLKALTGKARMLALAILGSAILLIGIVVLVFAQRLTGKIKALIEVAERISVGDLEMEVGIKSGDEIGGLAEAMMSMQDNIRLSIEALRRRR